MPERVGFLDLAAANRELRAELLAAFTRVLDAGRFIGGGEVAEFEAAWATYCGAAAAAGVGNGLEALALILMAMDIGPGDAVVVPSWTFIATWLAVSRVGAEVVPVEVDPATGNLDPAALDAELGRDNLRAVIAVHLYGQPADMARIRAAADPGGIPVIEDAAQAHGARLDGVRAGALGYAAGFSFYPAKNLGALGDAGAVVSDDRELVDRVRRLGNYGSVDKYDHREIGGNSRLDTLQAALLGERLTVLDTWNERRRVIAARYREGLAGLDWLELPEVIAGAEPVWHLFVVRTPLRDRLREHLDSAGIDTGLHYPIANHRSGAYASAGFELPVAELLAARSLSLPVGPHMPDADVDRVIAAVLDFRP